MEGYKLHHTPSSSLKGGTAVYVNEDFGCLERIDISAQTNMYESTWVEIKGVVTWTKLSRLNYFFVKPA